MPELLHPAQTAIQLIHRVHAHIHSFECPIQVPGHVHEQKELDEQAQPPEEARTKAKRPVRPGQLEEPAPLLLLLLLLVSYQEQSDRMQPAQAAPEQPDQFPHISAQRHVPVCRLPGRVVSAVHVSAGRRNNCPIHTNPIHPNFVSIQINFQCHA